MRLCRPAGPGVSAPTTGLGECRGESERGVGGGAMRIASWPWPWRTTAAGRSASLLLLASLALQLRTGGGVEAGAGKKRARAPAAPDLDDSPGQALEERDRPGQTPAPVPPGFVSPSVLEYLELGKSIPGRPGTDYPVLSEVPYTDFYCDRQPYPGFFADMETRCQAWHYCDIDGRQASFLCPNGTQFSQAVFVCDWWFNVRCDLSAQLYPINGRLYRRPPKLSPTRPHRVITKQLLDNIFL